MKKITLLRITGCVLFLSLMLYPSNSDVYYGEGNIFTGNFTEPCEISYVIFWDGDIVKFTSYENYRIDLTYGHFEEFLKKRGRKIEDIAIKIHNHLPGGGYNFSEDDLRFMRWMRKNRFEGSYCLRLPTGKIKYKRDKNIALIQFLKKKETKQFLKKFRRKFPKAYKELVTFLKEMKNG